MHIKTKITSRLKKEKKIKSLIVNKNNKSVNKIESNNEGRYVRLYSDAADNALNDQKQVFDESITKPDKRDLSIKETKRKIMKNKNKNVLLNQNTTKDKKKERIKQILQNEKVNRKFLQSNGEKLRHRMMEKLKAAQFRYLNEKLYTSKGSEAQDLFAKDPEAFKTYHEGYQQQVKKWPINPLDIIVKKISKMPKTTLIADLGCGEAALSRRVPHTVRSFDLVSQSPGVEQCDMSRTPLLAASVGVAVYCLSLMGTELTRYLVEANRILKTGGLLMIAEVESRFSDIDVFIKDVERLGFKLTKSDRSHDVFLFLDFKKVNEAPAKKKKMPYINLKPCLYKRR